MARSILSPARSPWFLLALAVLIAYTLSGCGGGGGDVPGSSGGSFPTNLPNYHAPEEWIALIQTAGLQEYADLGRQLVKEGKVKIVSPPTLDVSYNAYSWNSEEEIWINSPIFSRYPDIVQQATIFLHELIHIKYGEETHNGPWWSAQDQFVTYWRNHPLTS